MDVRNQSLGVPQATRDATTPASVLAFADAVSMKARALVAWNLRRIRVKRGTSQERLAYDAEVDRSYVGGLERQTHNPTVDVLDRLAANFGRPAVRTFCAAGQGGDSAQTPAKGP